MIPLPQQSAGAEEYPPLSALNDLLFCARRCFLHRVEGVWIENVHTVSGSQDHRRAHAVKDTESADGRVSRGLRLVSHSLKVQGVADVVEWIDGVPFPVEYKRGKRRKWDNDDVQLCAQAICLEEMNGVPLPRGAIYHVKTKRRRDVLFTPKLRQLTVDAAARLHTVLRSAIAPAPVIHPKCQQCSLHDICIPEIVQNQGSFQVALANLYTAPS